MRKVTGPLALRSRLLAPLLIAILSLVVNDVNFWREKSVVFSTVPDDIDP